MHFRNPTGEYTNLLLQCYLFYSTMPYKTAFLLETQTDIDWFKKQKSGFHYYSGSDLTNFRTPDDKLPAIGEPYTQREFEIIALIKSGMSSEQIAKQEFLGVSTVNTHRKNILSKSVQKSMPELIRVS